MSDVLRHGVPMPFEWEAPSSWLGRLSLAQGCGVHEVKRFLGFPAEDGRDVDSLFRGAIAASVRRRSGLGETAFQRTETAVDLMDPRWLRASGWPRFQYCPLCLAERQTAYLDIHWRFYDVGRCLIHGCYLEGRCPQCRASLSAPTNVFTSQAGREGFASQRRCQRCCCDLACAPARPHDPRLPLFSKFELRLLANEELVPAEVPMDVRAHAKAIREWPWPARR